jgi:hypothetical protein
MGSSRRIEKCPQSGWGCMGGGATDHHLEDHLNPVQLYHHTKILLCVYSIEVIQFWIPPGRCITWEMGGSQFTMTLWMGLSQTPNIKNGYDWDPPTPAGWRQVPDPTMTEHGICPGASICYIYSGIK